MNIILDLNDLKLLGKEAKVFGTGAHICLPFEYAGKKIKIILGNSVILDNKLVIDYSDSELLQRKAVKFGKSSHVIVPKEYLGKKIKILVEKNQLKKEDKK